MKTRTFSAAIAAILILSLAACSTSPLQILDLAVGAAEIALPLALPAAGVDPATTTAVESYLQATSTAIAKASDILAGTGTDAAKSAQIVAAFAGIAAPVVPAKYQALVNAIQRVAQYVAQFIGSLPAPAAAGKMSASISTVSASDAAKLAQIKARAQALIFQIQHLPGTKTGVM